MPFNLAQWTGIAVTVIVVSGSDMDIVFAVPLGLFAGALATFFTALAERHQALRAQPVPVKVVSKNTPSPKKAA